MLKSNHTPRSKKIPPERKRRRSERRCQHFFALTENNGRVSARCDRYETRGRVLFHAAPPLRPDKPSTPATLDLRPDGTTSPPPLSLLPHPPFPRHLRVEVTIDVYLTIDGAHERGREGRPLAAKGRFFQAHLPRSTIAN